MTLIRKTRVSGTSLVVTIPSQLVEAFNINGGDLVEIIPVKNGEIIIKKTINDKPYEYEKLNQEILNKTN